MNVEEMNELRVIVAVAEAKAELAELKLRSDLSEVENTKLELNEAETELQKSQAAFVHAVTALEVAQVFLKQAELTRPRTDVEIAMSKMIEARSQGSKVINVSLKSKDHETAIELCVSEIRTGERILISLPVEYIRLRNNLPDCECLDELNAEFTCPYILNNKLVLPLPKDVFFAIRYEDDTIICDLYRL